MVSLFDIVFHPENKQTLLTFLGFSIILFVLPVFTFYIFFWIFLPLLGVESLNSLLLISGLICIVVVKVCTSIYISISFQKQTQAEDQQTKKSNKFENSFSSKSNDYDLEDEIEVEPQIQQSNNHKPKSKNFITKRSTRSIRSHNSHRTSISPSATPSASFSESESLSSTIRIPTPKTPIQNQRISQYPLRQRSPLSNKGIFYYYDPLAIPSPN